MADVLIAAVFGACYGVLLGLAIVSPRLKKRHEQRIQHHARMESLRRWKEDGSPMLWDLSDDQQEGGA